MGPQDAAAVASAKARSAAAKSTETTADKIVLRDMTGAVTTVLTADVKEDKHLPMSMMPEGLANALSLGDFAALVHFLAAKK